MGKQKRQKIRKIRILIQNFNQKSTFIKQQFQKIQLVLNLYYRNKYKNIIPYYNCNFLTTYRMKIQKTLVPLKVKPINYSNAEQRQHELPQESRNSLNQTSEKINLPTDQNKPSEEAKELIDETKVLHQKTKDNQVIYYLPTYLRTQLNDVISYDADLLQATANLTIFFSIQYGQIDEKIVKQLISKIKLEFRLDQPTIELNQISVQSQNQYQDTKRNMMHWRIQNKSIKFTLWPDTFLFPFEFLKLNQLITIPPVELEIQQGNRVIVVFNLLSSEDMPQNIIQADEVDVGNYILAPKDLTLSSSYQPQFQSGNILSSNLLQNTSLVQATATANEALVNLLNVQDNTSPRVNKKQIIQKIVSNKDNQMTDEDDKPFLPQSWTTNSRKYSDLFSQATLTIGLKKRGSSASTISNILFMMILGFLTLAVFFQKNDLSATISSVATISVAIAALIISLRQSFTFKDSMTWIEQLLFYQLFTTIFPLAQALYIKDDEGYEFDWQANGFFITSLFLECFVTVYVIITYCFLGQWAYMNSEREQSFDYDKALYQFKNFKPKSWKNSTSKKVLQALSSKYSQEQNKIRILEKKTL